MIIIKFCYNKNFVDLYIHIENLFISKKYSRNYVKRLFINDSRLSFQIMISECYKSCY